MDAMYFVRLAVAALIPMILGFIWYNPNVFGKAWMKSVGITDEDAPGGNMAVIFGLSYILALVLGYYLAAMAGYHDGGDDQHFLHGAFHGVKSGAIVAMPVLITNSLFERRGFANIAINMGYWLLSFALMGGLLFAWH